MRMERMASLMVIITMDKALEVYTSIGELWYGQLVHTHAWELYMRAASGTSTWAKSFRTAHLTRQYVSRKIQFMPVIRTAI